MSGCSDPTSSNGGAARRSGRRTLAETRARYLPRVLAEERVTPYIAMQGDEADRLCPVVRGARQRRRLVGRRNRSRRARHRPVAGRPELLGRGLGTQLVKALVERLFADPEVSRIQTDPSPANLRAIRCYEKAGFRRLRTIVTPDGPAEYMVRERFVAR